MPRGTRGTPVTLHARQRQAEYRACRALSQTACAVGALLRRVPARAALLATSSAEASATSTVPRGTRGTPVTLHARQRQRRVVPAAAPRRRLLPQRHWLQPRQRVRACLCCRQHYYVLLCAHENTKTRCLFDVCYCIKLVSCWLFVACHSVWAGQLMISDVLVSHTNVFAIFISLVLCLAVRLLSISVVSSESSL